jgi:hypothetical protein
MFKVCKNRPGVLVHAYNLSYKVSIDQENHGSRSSQAKRLDSSSKNQKGMVEHACNCNYVRGVSKGINSEDSWDKSCRDPM